MQSTSIDIRVYHTDMDKIKIKLWGSLHVHVMCRTTERMAVRTGGGGGGAIAKKTKEFKNNDI